MLGTSSKCRVIRHTTSATSTLTARDKQRAINEGGAINATPVLTWDGSPRPTVYGHTGLSREPGGADGAGQTRGPCGSWGPGRPWRAGDSHCVGSSWEHASARMSTTPHSFHNNTRMIIPSPPPPQPSSPCYLQL